MRQLVAHVHLLYPTKHSNDDMSIEQVLLIVCIQMYYLTVLQKKSCFLVHVSLHKSLSFYCVEAIYKFYPL